MADSDSLVKPPSDTLLRDVHAPRLSILHLMLWTLCSGVILSLLRQSDALEQLPAEYAAIFRASNVLHGVLQGAGLAGSLVLGYMRYRFGPPWIGHPGHWLLVIPGAMTIIFLPLFVLLQSLNWTGFSSVAYFLILSLATLAMSGAYFFAAQRTKLKPWRILFKAMFLIALLEGTSHVVGFQLPSLYSYSPWSLWLLQIPSWGNYVLGGWLVVVAVLDLSAGQRRDWLHWTGVATWVGSVVIQAVQTFGPALLSAANSQAS